LFGKRLPKHDPIWIEYMDLVDQKNDIMASAGEMLEFSQYFKRIY